MARTIEFSKEEVIAAANKILESGKRINGTSLRNIIGKGRPANLMNLYKELEQSGEIALIVDEPVEVEQSHELPPEVNELKSAIMGDMDLLIQRINDLAHNTVEGRLNSSIAQANEAASEATRRMVELEDDMNKAYNETEDIREELGVMTENNQSLSITIADLESKLKVAKTKLGDRDGRITDLTGELKQTKNQLAKETENVKEVSNQLSVEKSNNSRLTKENTSLKDKLEEANEAKSLMVGELKVRNEQLDKQTAALDTANSSLATLDAHSMKLELENEQLSETKAALTTANEAMTKEVKSLTAEAKAESKRTVKEIKELNSNVLILTQTLAEKESHLVTAEKTNTGLTSKLESLTQSLVTVEKELEQVREQSKLKGVSTDSE